MSLSAGPGFCVDGRPGLVAPHVVKQIKVIQSDLRQSPVMHGIITKLTPDDMADVAAYVQSL